MTDNTSNIGYKIRQIRESRKMSQQLIADETGLARSTVNSIERNSQRPSIEFLKKFCELTGVSADDILFETKPQNKAVNDSVLNTLINESDIHKREKLAEEFIGKVNELESDLKIAREENAKLQKDHQYLKDEMRLLLDKLKNLFQ